MLALIIVGACFVVYSPASNISSLLKEAHDSNDAPLPHMLFRRLDAFESSLRGSAVASAELWKSYGQDGLSEAQRIAGGSPPCQVTLYTLLVVSALPPKAPICETGFFKGVSAANFLGGGSGKVVSYDLTRTFGAAGYAYLSKEFPDRFTLVEGPSEKRVPEDKAECALVSVDGNHGGEGPYLDHKNFAPRATCGDNVVVSDDTFHCPDFAAKSYCNICGSCDCGTKGFCNDCSSGFWRSVEEGRIRPLGCTSLFRSDQNNQWPKGFCVGTYIREGCPLRGPAAELASVADALAVAGIVPRTTGIAIGHAGMARGAFFHYSEAAPLALFALLIPQGRAACVVGGVSGHDGVPAAVTRVLLAATAASGATVHVWGVSAAARTAAGVGNNHIFFHDEGSAPDFGAARCALVALDYDATDALTGSSGTAATALASLAGGDGAAVIVFGSVDGANQAAWAAATAPGGAVKSLACLRFSGEAGKPGEPQYCIGRSAGRPPPI